MSYKLHHISTMQTKFILCCHMLHQQQSGYSPTHLNGHRRLKSALLKLMVAQHLHRIHVTARVTVELHPVTCNAPPTT